MLQEKVERHSTSPRKSRAKKQIAQANVERSTCGRPRLTAAFLSIWYEDGTLVQPSIEAIRRSGACPECHVEWLIERGLIEPSLHEELRCNHIFRGLEETELSVLLASLDHVTLHDRLKINVHVIAGCA
jgi:hypothetical protein